MDLPRGTASLALLLMLEIDSVEILAAVSLLFVTEIEVCSAVEVVLVHAAVAVVHPSLYCQVAGYYRCSRCLQRCYVVDPKTDLPECCKFVDFHCK